MKTIIKNARIISPGIDLPGAAVEIEGKPLTAVYPAGSELPAADKVVYAEGRMLDVYKRQEQRMPLAVAFSMNSTASGTSGARETSRTLAMEFRLATSS